jgi:hypothetical protein
MRVLIAVLALVATPFIASVAQDRENRDVRHSDARSGDKDADRENCEKDAENSHRWQNGRHKGEKNDDKQCDPPAGGTGGTGGTTTMGVISGLVYVDVFGTTAPVFGWQLALTGPGVNMTASSDALGNYAFPPVPVGGPYTLCQSQVTTWVQVFPANNACYTITVVAAGVPNENFGFLMQ